MQEEWRPVVGYEGIYEVSNLGQVKSLARTVEGVRSDGSTYHYSLEDRLMIQSKSCDGYHEVSLTKNKKSKTLKVHRLVVQAFKPEEWNPDLEVNHIDGNKDHNYPDNLEMVDHQGNMDHYWNSDVFAEHRVEYLEGVRERTTDNWKNPEFRKKVQDVFDSPEYKKAHSEAGKKVFDRPGMREEAGARSKEMWAQEGFHDRQIEAIKAGWSDPNKRAEASRRMQGLKWMHSADGKNVRVRPDEVPRYLANGYEEGRAALGGTRSIPVYCKETDTVYPNMSACDRALGLKQSDTYAILNNSKLKRLKKVQEKYTISYATNKKSSGKVSY